MKRLLLIIAFLAGASLAWGYAFITNDSGQPIKWPLGPIPMQIKVDNSTQLSDGLTAATSIQAAMTDPQRGWNTYLPNVQLSPTLASPGSGSDENHLNEIFFTSTAYTYGWDSNTLALTTVWYSGAQRTEGDILFNNLFTWDSYRGALRSNGVMDIQRVALHELGHILGLDHPDENGQTVTAIMNSVVSDIDSLQLDDIYGVQDLYGGAYGPNDNFAGAVFVFVGSNNNVVLNSSNITATKEPGEPNHGGDAGGHSVWWKWIAPDNCTVDVNTLGSSFDTTLGVYVGTSVSSLTTVASNHLAITGQPYSSVQFHANKGTSYYIAVDGFEGATGSIELRIDLVFDAFPIVTIQPQNVTVSAGQTAIFTAAASGGPYPTLQWQRLASGAASWADVVDGGAFRGTATMNLDVTTDITMNGDQFRLEASNSVGIAYSNPASLVVAPGALPGIDSQPVDLTLFVGMKDGIGVGAERATSYQWYKNGQAVAGQTGEAFSFSNAQESDDGTYYVVVSNGQGSITSATATITVLPVAGIASFQASRDYTMILRTDGSRWVCGYDRFDMSALSENVYPPQPYIPAITLQAGTVEVAAAAAGSQHDLYIDSGQTLWAVGTNTNGQLGDGTSTERDQPVPISQEVVFVAAAYNVSYFIKSDGSLWGMGQNSSGQLGDGTIDDRHSPVRIADNASFVSTTIGFACFIKSDRTLWTMGSNYDGTAGHHYSPVLVAHDVILARMAESGLFFITSDHSLWGAGVNSFGQLGDSTTTNRSTPILIAQDVVNVTPGYYHTLYVKTDGSLWITGKTGGQFGDADSVVRTTPVMVASNVATISAGLYNSFYLTTDGKLWGTGDDQYGKTGGSAVDSSVRTPVVVASGPLVLPTAPTGLLATAFASGKVRLSWTPTATASRYSVWRGQTNEFSSAALLTSDVVGTLYYDNSAPPGKSYYWIVPENAAGSGVAGDFASVAVLPVSSPSDLNGDGHPDILWTNTATGDRAIWYLNGTGIGSFGYLAGIPTEWNIVGTADFDGDGQTDILWEDTVTGDRSIWLMNGTTILNFAYLAYVDPVWHIAAVGDFNGDGKADVIWENTSTGDRAIWFLNGTGIDSFGYIAGIPTDWHIVGAADVDGDGQTDLIWENLVTGDRTVWFMNGATLSSFGYIANVPGAWHIAMVADFDGDGLPDLLWENTTTGDRAIWLMNGTTQLSAPYLAYVDPVWHVAP